MEFFSPREPQRYSARERFVRERQKQKKEFIDQLLTYGVKDVNDLKSTISFLDSMEKERNDRILEALIIVIALIGGFAVGIYFSNNIVRTAGFSAASAALTAVIQRRSIAESAKIAAREVISQYKDS